MPARLLVVSTQLTRTGGIENHLFEFCARLSSSDLVVDVAVLNTEDPELARQQFARVNGRLFLLQSNRRSERMAAIVRVCWILRRGRYAALYTNGQGGSIRWIGACRPKRTRWTHHHHTSGDAADQATWPQNYHRAMRNCDSLIACSSRNAKMMAPIISRQPHVVPCFSRQVHVGNRAGPAGRPIRFGYFGRLIHEKGLSTILRLAVDPATEGIEFHVWGQGEAYTGAELNATQRLFFHGPFAGEAELGHILGYLDAYLLFSIHPEGLPIALLECLGAGLPWIATDRGGIRDIVCDPQATRIVSATPGYEEALASTVAMASDLRSGTINHRRLTEAYASRFASSILVNQWRNVLLG